MKQITLRYSWSHGFSYRLVSIYLIVLFLKSQIIWEDKHVLNIWFLGDSELIPFWRNISTVKLLKHTRNECDRSVQNGRKMKIRSYLWLWLCTLNFPFALEMSAKGTLCSQTPQSIAKQMNSFIVSFFWQNSHWGGVRAPSTLIGCNVPDHLPLGPSPSLSTWPKSPFATQFNASSPGLSCSVVIPVLSCIACSYCDGLDDLDLTILPCLGW